MRGTTVKKKVSFTLFQLYVTRDLLSNNNNSTANCMVYLAKKNSDQSENG